MQEGIEELQIINPCVYIVQASLPETSPRSAGSGSYDVEVNLQQHLPELHGPVVLLLVAAAAFRGR